MTSHSVGNFSIPTDELIFFSGVGQPPTMNIYIYMGGFILKSPWVDIMVKTWLIRIMMSEYE